MNDTLAIKHREAYKPPAMITGTQLRAARALIGWTSQKLADESGVHYATISRAEQFDGVPSIRATTLAQLQETLESAGIMFQSPGDTRDGGPGVRLKR